jgi:hypothetical protein
VIESKNIKRLSCLLLAWGVLFGGCLPPRANLPQSIADENCLPPQMEFAFPLNSPNGVATPQISLPLQPWQSVSDMPMPEQSDTYYRDKVEFARSNGVSMEVWILRTSTSRTGPKNSLLIYDVGTNRWQQFPDAFSDFSAEVSDLYLSRSGEIWAVGFGLAPFVLNPTENQRYIGRYNASQKRFSLVSFPQGFPPGWIIYDQARNLFWVFQKERAIYSVDPVHLKTTKRADVSDLNIVAQVSMTIAGDGDIYFLNFGNLERWTQSSAHLFKYDPKGDRVEGIPFHEALILDPVTALFGDKSGKLWIGDQAWRTPDGTWYEIVRSPLFVTHMPESGVTYQWDTPEIVLESSDGRLWFKGFNGMIWLSPQEKDWCWFTTYQSNIVEDEVHNLWIIADNKLYKYSLDAK